MNKEARSDEEAALSDNIIDVLDLSILD